MPGNPGLPWKKMFCNIKPSCKERISLLTYTLAFCSVSYIQSGTYLDILTRCHSAPPPPSFTCNLVYRRARVKCWALWICREIQAPPISIAYNCVTSLNDVLYLTLWRLWLSTMKLCCNSHTHGRSRTGTGRPCPHTYRWTLHTRDAGGSIEASLSLQQGSLMGEKCQESFTKQEVTAAGRSGQMGDFLSRPS